MKRTLGHVGMGTGTVAPFDQVYDAGMYVTPDDIYKGKVTALVIWGGADISPSLYGEEPTRNCGAGKALSNRDFVEASACKAAIGMGIPIIGVCRGAQLLCALAGGKLVQDVYGHCNGPHHITTDTGRSIITSSVHHQMMYPFKMSPDKYKMIAWASNRHSPSYEGVKVAPEVEPEIIYFPEIKGLAIQGHPEFMDDRDEFVLYCNDLVKEYLYA